MSRRLVAMDLQSGLAVEGRMTGWAQAD